MPPLRERREDIPLLAQHFLRVYAAKNNRQLDGLHATRRSAALEALRVAGQRARAGERGRARGGAGARRARRGGDLPDTVAERSVMIVRGADAGVDAAEPGGVLQDPHRARRWPRWSSALLEETLRMTKGNKTLTAKHARHRPEDRLPQAQGRRGGRGGATIAAAAERPRSLSGDFRELRYEVADGRPHRHPRPARQAERRDVASCSTS